jgi:peptidylprolyl isomerase
MICTSLSAQESTAPQQQPEIQKISEAFGHLIGKNLKYFRFEFDMQAVVQGLKDASAGKIAPMSELRCIQAITTIQEAAFKEQSQLNLH